MKRAILLLSSVVLSLVQGCSGSSNTPDDTGEGLCQEIEPDKEFHCPYIDINEDDDLILSKFNALYSVKADGSDKETLILKSPEGWTIHQNSISPNHERMLLTMIKDKCPGDWSDWSGKSCGWGNYVIWYAYHVEDKWVLLNLASIYGPIYGFRSDIHGWTSWQNNKYAFFNGLILPDDVNPDDVREGIYNSQAYQIIFNSDRDIDIGYWGGSEMFTNDCLTGRLFPSHIQDSDTCINGSKVVFARRCVTEPKSDDYWAWWNTKNMDGTGGQCNNQGPPMQVPVLRVYIVETDAQCQPKTAFDINTPIHQPNTDSIYRHMGRTPEWGEMQPAISKDGRFVAFHTQKGFRDSDPEDNCAGFRYYGDSYAVVKYCELNNDLKCKEVKQLPEPELIYGGQGQPFFFEENNQTSLIRSEAGGSMRTNIETTPGESIFLFEGMGGYPLE